MTHDRSNEAPGHVARALTRYLDGEQFDAGAAMSDVMGDLCSWLGIYVDGIVRRSEQWSPWWAIDDACPHWIERDDDGAVRIHGIAQVLGDSSISTDQPFDVTVRLGSTRSTITSGLVRFGDADAGLRHDGPRKRWPDVTAWVIEVLDSE